MGRNRKVGAPARFCFPRQSSLPHVLFFDGILLIGKLLSKLKSILPISVSYLLFFVISQRSQHPCQEDTLSKKLFPLLTRRKQTLTRCQCLPRAAAPWSPQAPVLIKPPCYSTMSSVASTGESQLPESSTRLGINFS